MEGKFKSLYIQSLQICLLNRIRRQISKPSYTTWFENFSIVDLDHNKSIVFATDTQMKKEWLETRYIDLVKNLLAKIENTDDYKDISFIFSKERGKPEDFPQIMSGAFDFLFEGANNDYDEIYKGNIEENSVEELMELALGKEELERQKALHQIKMLKADYGESELNILECVFCHNDDVPNVDLDIELKSSNKRIKSIKVRGGKCSQCGEEYYESEDMEIIRNVKSLLVETLP